MQNGALKYTHSIQKRPQGKHEGNRQPPLHQPPPQKFVLTLSGIQENPKTEKHPQKHNTVPPEPSCNPFPSPKT